MSNETVAPPTPSPEFQAAFSALTAGKHIARESWEGKKKVTAIEAPKLPGTRPPCLLLEVEGQPGHTPMPVTEDLAAAKDWVIIP